ncbi:hypothetical protein V3C33_06640 [Micrococcaceae bacterium Sec5.7]
MTEHAHVPARKKGNWGAGVLMGMFYVLLAVALATPNLLTSFFGPFGAAAADK